LEAGIFVSLTWIEKMGEFKGHPVGATSRSSTEDKEQERYEQDLRSLHYGY
jgi:hypothetical protein